MLLVSRHGVTNVGVLLATGLACGIPHHICHFPMCKLLSLVETHLGIVVLGAIIAIKLVLDGSHDNLVCSWLVGNLF